MIQGFLSHAKRGIALLLAIVILTAALPFAAQAEEVPFADLEAESVTFRPHSKLLQKKDFIISAQKLYTQTNGYVFVDLRIQNIGKKDLVFNSEGFYIQGYNTTSAYIYETVKAGKTATVRVGLDVLPLAAVGVTIMDQLEMIFSVEDDDTYDTLYEDCTVTIPLGIPIQMEYNPYEACIYEEEGFRLSLLGSAQVGHRASPCVIFLLENFMDGPIRARNDGDFSVNNTQFEFYIAADAPAYSRTVFAAWSIDSYFKDYPTNVGYLSFPLDICTGNLNTLVNTAMTIRMATDGRILNFTHVAKENPGYEISRKESGPVIDSVDDYVVDGLLDEEFIAALYRKYPAGTPRYADGAYDIRIHEALAMYLEKLKVEGYDFNVVECTNLCTDTAYVVELTDQGKSVIQVAFTLKEAGDTQPWIVTLGCSANGYQDLEALNSYLSAMWMAYDLLNIHMTPEKHEQILEHSQSSSSSYGTMLRGEYDRLGYVYTMGEEMYLIISPDLSLPIFDGMPVE